MYLRAIYVRLLGSVVLSCSAHRILESDVLVPIWVAVFSPGPPRSTMRRALAFAALSSAATPALGFVAGPAEPRHVVRTNTFVPPTTLKAAANDDGFVSSIQKSFEIAQKSASEGADFKQIIADVLAGEYDAGAVNAKLDELIASAPAVMFIWEASPFSKKAIRAMEMMGADVKVVRLDDPWEEGNPMRAELGKRVGRTSVPCVFIGGEYVGGYDGGVGEESPGLVDLAFQGTLIPKLEAAGALKAKEEAKVEA